MLQYVRNSKDIIVWLWAGEIYIKLIDFKLFFQQSCEFPELRFFAQRHSTALLQREALRRRRDAMRHENMQLHGKIEQLRQHQDTMTVSGHSKPGPNSTAGPGAPRREIPGQGPPGCALTVTSIPAPIVTDHLQKRKHHVHHWRKKEAHHIKKNILYCGIM